jgi:two-component system OmpR family sensor kinase
VSHELRSPLARLQLAIDLARQDPDKLGVSQERVSAEAARLDEMVGELLTLSKLENGLQNSEEYFDLVDVVRLVVEDARFEATPLGVIIVAETPDLDSEQEWIVSGSGRLMRRAIENILRNAIRFSRAGQSVTVSLSRAKARLLLVIADEGPGVPAKQAVGPLFQPFFQARPGDDHGYGLGLSIAQRAINALGGSIEAANRMPSGFVVTIAIPEML